MEIKNCNLILILLSLIFPFNGLGRVKAIILLIIVYLFYCIMYYIQAKRKCPICSTKMKQTKENDFVVFYCDNDKIKIQLLMGTE